MKYLVIFFVLFFFFDTTVAYSQKSDADTKSKNKQKLVKVIVFGDSLVSGLGLDAEYTFKKSLERKLKSEGYDNIQVLDGTFTGLTTQLALERVQIVLDFKPDIVILALGSNDAFSQLKPQTTYANLASIVQMLQQNNVKILLTGVKLPKGAHPQYQDKFQSMYEYLADKYKIELYPNILKDIAGNTDLTLADRIHPNQAGMETIVNNVYPHLELILFRQFKEIILKEKRKEILKKQY
ncbi:MAG: GDSL-type esterase/lipase family protein [Rickettsiales bacterium]|nr:GDSL-type esterase/lipase family protein [Pseudomonadota bacterium]MDA0966297.1 GDSL-type esterase/lipase family protein [Pseudomonadota bacterium]MDG4543038.1 GDSL-type esterase/lipase family protein [Rickettsiales bacterium]MDG4545236.1 GDSL-type esterase/lipase family protein [Rickettsiales bacterium]MDG4547685.1 GDSL-type esterase/lipase family protein [Rickettsiales bacterium]